MTKINCPHCHSPFELETYIYEQLQSQFKEEMTHSQKKALEEQAQRFENERKQYQTQISEAQTIQMEALRKEEELQKKAANMELEVKQATLEQAQTLREELKKEQDQIIQDQEKRFEQERRQHQKQLVEANNKHLEALRKEEELQKKAANIDLQIQKKLLEETKSAREDIRKELEAKYKLDWEEKEYNAAQKEQQRIVELEQKLTQKKLQLESTQKVAEELKSKLNQGSQQNQGEASEVDMYVKIQSQFPKDQLQEIPKGRQGADILQEVVSPLGMPCGSILWEIKQTKEWSNNWIPKLKQDALTANSHISILVSTALPKNIKNFDEVDGVWVCSPFYALSLTKVLRLQLIEIAQTKTAMKGRDTKAEQLYEYLMSPQFRQYIQSILDSTEALKANLEKEKNAMKLLWKKREKEIDNLAEAITSSQGTISGIAGEEYPLLDSLDLEKISE